ncbi:MAG: anti-sigma factor family protein [Blastocatellia bacterium]
MNCEECQEIISLYIDQELDSVKSGAVDAHLAVCPECSKLYDEFALILDSCRDEAPSELAPPNPQALWCRINNIIETEQRPEPISEPEPKRLFPRVLNLSFGQMGAAVLGIALVSSLLTVVGIRNYFEPAGDDFTSRSSASQTTFEKLLSKVGLTDTPQQARERRLKEQESAIDYWNKRVQMRRGQWDTKMRDAFDRNLSEINQAVNEYTMILEQDPQDELSGEMLDSALNEKMNLLREFSEL